MTDLHKITKIGLLILALFKGMDSYAQNEVYFKYECDEKIISPTTAKIILESAQGDELVLFSDTVKNYHFSENNFFKSRGEQNLSISFNAGKYGKDSLDYHFELSGSEIITVISISFDYKERLIKKEDIFVKGEKVLNGYIRIDKYYEAPKSVTIEHYTEEEGDEYYKGPFFRIKNNSKDTLYGEHLPGYFWGTLSFIRNDSLIKSFIGILDYEFIESPPLYPDSTKLATVGSFGLWKKLIPFKYRFEVMLADEWQSQGIGIFKQRPNFDWWAGTKEYYKLKLDFEVEKQTPNR